MQGSQEQNVPNWGSACQWAVAERGLCNGAHHSRLAGDGDVRETGLCGTREGLGREPDACDVPGTGGEPAVTSRTSMKLGLDVMADYAQRLARQAAFAFLLHAP